MTETEGEYKILGQPSLHMVSCKRCGTLIGRETVSGDHIFLNVNNFLLEKIHGVCECGEPLNWSRPDVSMRRIMERKLKTK